MSGPSLTAAVKAIAREEGFARVGVTSADVSFDQSAYRNWLAGGCHGDMAYLARNVDKRHNPGRLVDGAGSIVCLAVGYAPSAPATGDAFIARYARGRDYHKVLKQRCRRVMDRLREIAPSFEGRAFVDAAPIAERSLAAAGGVGWIGRNGCLIVGELGSYVVLCEIICNLPLAADQPCRQDCGDCRLCVDACPTGALLGDGLLDARRCRSYLTIEHRRAIDPALWPMMGSCVFGCDTCQVVCPHNQASPPGDEELTCPEPVERACPEPVERACPELVERACPELVERAGPGDAAAEPALADVLGWSADDWDAATQGSAMRRATHAMFLRNAVLAAGNSGDEGLIDALIALQAGRADLADEVAWALRRIVGR